MFSLNPIKRRIPDRAVGKNDIEVYLQREIAPELKAIRALLDLMISSPLISVAGMAAGPGLQTTGTPVAYAPVGTASTSTDQAVRIVFDPSLYPVVNLASARSIALEYWLSATGAGGTPEVALFNEATGIEIAATSAQHVTGTTASRYVTMGAVVGDGADEIPDEETVFTVRGRDVAGTVDVIVESARLIVSYV